MNRERSIDADALSDMTGRLPALSFLSHQVVLDMMLFNLRYFSKYTCLAGRDEPTIPSL